jgi:protein TonB
MPTEIAVAAPRSAEPTPALPAATPHPTAQRASTEAIDSYRRQLTDLFAREHEYPRVAAMRGWEGEVRLRLRVARRGQLLGVRVDRSSGFEVLDQDALALLEGHGKLPPLPEALEVAEIEVVVPITYRLRKAT